MGTHAEGCGDVVEHAESRLDLAVFKLRKVRPRLPHRRAELGQREVGLAAGVANVEPDKKGVKSSGLRIWARGHDISMLVFSIIERN